MADLTPSRRTTLNLVTLNLAGKVLAIGKTLFIAALFGTSSHLDAFWVAYSLPLLLPNVLSLDDHDRVRAALRREPRRPHEPGESGKAQTPSSLRY